MGSISHTNDYCVVAISSDPSVKSIGIDLEEAGRLKEPLWGRLFTETEISRLKELGQPAEQMRLAAIMFSAKEAFYKSDFPLHQKQYEFTEVEVEVSETTRQLQLWVKNRADITPLTGYFVSGLTHVMTIVIQ
jgi:phosphopantetheine--protein transferase-like protein